MVAFSVAIPLLAALLVVNRQAAATDLDCADIGRHDFTVRQPDDPHRFDADKDGIGCESRQS